MTDVYTAVDQIVAGEGFAVTAVCDVLEVSRSAYYAWCDEAPTVREQRDDQFMPLVRDIFWEHQRRYGARRIAFEMRQRRQPCGVAGRECESDRRVGERPVCAPCELINWLSGSLRVAEPAHER